MKYIIYGVVILVVLYMSRKYLKGWILTLRDKRSGKNKVVNKDLVYVPVSSSRVFNFAIEITELGNGKASISVVKQQ